MVSVVLVPFYNRNRVYHHVALLGEGTVVPLRGRVDQAGRELADGVEEGHFYRIFLLIHYAVRGVPKEVGGGYYPQWLRRRFPWRYRPATSTQWGLLY